MAVPGRVQCAHHAEQSKAGWKKARRLRLAGSLLPVPAGEGAGGVGAGVGDGGGGRQGITLAHCRA